MKKIYEIYTTFSYPGVMYDETKSKLIYSSTSFLKDTSDLIQLTIAKALKMKDKNWFSISFNRSTHLEENPTKKYKGDVSPIAGTYYVGEVMTLKEVEKLNKTNPDQYSIILSNMRINKWREIVKTHRGNHYPFDKLHDIVIARNL